MNSVPSGFTFSPDFSFLAVATNKSHTYQHMIDTAIKFVLSLRKLIHASSDQVRQQKLFLCHVCKNIAL